jgi:hypothetical protein
MAGVSTGASTVRPYVSHVVALPEVAALRGAVQELVTGLAGSTGSGGGLGAVASSASDGPAGAPDGLAAGTGSSATGVGIGTSEGPVPDTAGAVGVSGDVLQQALSTSASGVAGALGVAVPEVAEAVALVSIRSLEEVKRMVEAAQAVLTASVVDSRTTRREAVGRSVRGVPAEVRRDVALFRGVNTPTAKALVEVSVDAPVQAPQLFEQWVEGQVGEEKLVSFFKSTDLLTGEGRREADGEVAEVAGQVGVRDFRERVNRVVARLEPEQAAERVRKAHERRHISLRPTGEGMATLTGLMPGVAGQGVEAILSAYAKSRKSGGDERTEAQVKADALTGIVIGWAQATGRAPKGFTSTYRIKPGGATKPTAAENAADPAIGADAVDEMDDALPGFGEVEAAREAFARFLTDPAGTSGSGPGGDGLGADGTRPDGIGGSVLPPGVGVCVNLVITDVSLFGFTDTPAELFGLGPVPAPIAREMVKDAHARDVATLRRLYTDPASGALVGMESKSRIFPDGLA